jgi:exopolysaccharide biosynthesis polyprenyl glycosylphosphotransferase
MQVHQVVDVILFMVSFWLAYTIRADKDVIELFGLKEVSPFENHYWLYFVLIPVAPMVLEAQGFYSRPFLCSRRMTAWLLLRGCSVITMGLVIMLFLFKAEMARIVLPLFGLISFVVMMGKEELRRRALRTTLLHEQYHRRFVLIGTREETARMRKELRNKSEEPVQVVAELEVNETPVQRLIEVLHEHSINGVIISAKRSYFDQVEAAINACELEGVEVWLVADFFKPQISRTTLDEFFGQPILVFRTAPEASWGSVIKKLIDVVGSCVGLIVLSPLLLVVALVVKLTSPGPIFFCQQRSGLNGRPFILYKFRTMVTNAEQLKHELAAMNEMTGPVFKVTADPRVTKVGRFLRKFSIDELPQLYNVLRGEMSLVGPRPLPVDEVKRFSDLAHRRRLSVKPGLTCLWQVSGRNEVKDFQDWVRLDLEYIDNWSLWLDFKILCLTVPAVLTGAGAK